MLSKDYTTIRHGVYEIISIRNEHENGEQVTFKSKNNVHAIYYTHIGSR